jgi:cyclase
VVSAPAQDTFARRLIGCLDVRAGRVVKGVNFEGLRDAGDPAALAARYDAEGIDELVLLDVTATAEDRLALVRTVSDVAASVFIPLAVGGGIRSVGDAAGVIEAGADKVAINTAALGDPALITRIAGRFGSQAVVVAIDAKREGGRFAVRSHAGRTPTAWEAVDWAREAEARGAGEILLTSIDADGTLRGFDCPLTGAVSDAVGIPVIASGGAGGPDHFVEVFTAGRADAALAASIFHDRTCSVRAVKARLRDGGLPVRL